jgi:hypothetical protein
MWRTDKQILLNVYNEQCVKMPTPGMEKWEYSVLSINI